MNIGILASGNLGLSTLEALAQRGLRPIFIFTDKASSGIIDFGRALNLLVFVGNPRRGRASEFLRQVGRRVDLIFSINYLFLIDEDVQNFPRLGCLNIHGSLLPKYRGRAPHVWAIINNENVTGITMHFIDSGCDTGKIILQERIDIDKTMTGADVLTKFAALYPEMILTALSMFDNGIPEPREQDDSIATYFGRRSPDDGKIQWSWHRERIYNWVRAQAFPYPGAFSFRGDQKIVIDEISFSARGFRWDDVDGLVLTAGVNAEIKTPNGAIRIEKNRFEIELQAGDILN